MNFDWRDYLTLANELIILSRRMAVEEACARSAISRAYYSAFVSARNFARDRQEITLTGTGEDHRKVRKHFRDNPDRARKSIGITLGRLLDDRNQADYQDRPLRQPVSSAMAATKQAAAVLDALGNLP